MTDPGDELALRAGDRDRELAVAELRSHHLEGRLDADELEERLGRAYGARTLGDLAALLGDLPASGRRGPVPDVPAPAPPLAVRGFGVLSFAQVHHLSVPVDEAYTKALDSMLPAMLTFGYELVERRDGQSLVFEVVERPWWVVPVCVFAFPVGLLALTVKNHNRVRVDFLPSAGGRCRVTVSGQARRRVRKAFAGLSEVPPTR